MCELRSSRALPSGRQARKQPQAASWLGLNTQTAAAIDPGKDTVVIAFPFSLPPPTSRAARLPTTVATWLAIALLASSAWLADANMRGIQLSSAVADQVTAVQLASERLLSSLKDAETGERGYLLTGDPAYLEPYEAARTRLDADFARLDAAPLMTLERTGRIGRIRQLAGAQLDELRRTIALRRSGQAEAALQMVRTDQGKRAMGAIRAEVDALQSAAEATLAQARIDIRAARAWAGVVGLGALACALLGGVALAQRRAQRYVSARLHRLERFTRAFGLAQGIMRKLDGRITFWNSGAQRLYGYRPEEAVGRISHELLQTVFPRPRREIEAALLQDGHWHGELAHRHRDGTALNVVSHWALSRGEVGEADVVIEVGSDITPSKRAEEELREAGMQLRLALDASDQGTWRWEVGGNGELLWDARCKALFGFAADAPVDYAAWMLAIPAEDRTAAEADLARALDPADPNDNYACRHRAVHPDGTVLWLSATGRALFEPERGVAGRRVACILGTIRDVSDAKRAEQDAQRAGALLRAIVETAPGLIYAKDQQGRMVLANQPVMDAIGKTWAEVKGRTDLEFLDNRAEAELVVANDRRIMAQGTREAFEEVVSGKEGATRLWASTKAPLRDGGGAVVGLVGVSVDITDRKRIEDRLQLMVNELNHRVKNTLATVQAIASQTLRGGDAMVRRTLEGRLMALAAAHDVLTRESWEGASLDDVAAGALAPFGGRGGGRFQVSGPLLRLWPRAALALAMVLHELCTNALKYGALSAGSGRVAIRWEVVPGTSPVWRLTWTERGGPAVAPPARRGFGTRLVERSLAQDLGGTVAISFDDPLGVTCLAEAPIAEVVASAAAVPFPQVGGSRQEARP